MTIFSTLAPLFTWLVTMLIPGRNAATLTTECRNKCRIMTLVQGLQSYMLPDGSTSLQSIVERCYFLGDFPALWAIEGAGKDLAEWHMARNPNPANLLVHAKLAPQWNKALTMLHAGIGLGFARYWIEPLKTDCPTAELRVALLNFIHLCHSNSRPGYTGCALESLGLVSRFIHNAAFCRRIHDVLTEASPDTVAYFWRGCGRSLYFGPQNFLPGFSKPGQAISRCHALCNAEAPDEPARQGLLSGVAWATTVVNMETPEVMELVLANLPAYFGQNPAFENGVICSVVMRNDTTPNAPLIENFRNHQPADPKIAALWQQHILSPITVALTQIHPTLSRESRLEDAFRFHSPLP